MMYTENVSQEPLEIIRANECDCNDTSLATIRFRRLWNEIESLQAEIGAWRAAAVAHRAFVDAFNASPDREGPEVDETYNRMEEAQAATRPYEQAAIDAARK